MPQLEVDQRPEALSVLRPSAVVVRDQRAKRRRVEEPALDRTWTKHEIIDGRAERTAEPRVDRHRKAHLLSREDLWRQRVTHCLAEDILRRKPVQLEPSGKPRREL